MIELTIFSFVAGILTVLAPCILPLLPVVVGGGSLFDNNKTTVSLRHPLAITISLVVSIILFTLLLKSTTALLGVPTAIWSTISGGIIAIFGIVILFPNLWERFMSATGLAVASQTLIGSSQAKSGIKKDILLGVALGPVFNSCSPTYALIVAAILPASFGTGLIYLAAYSIGLGATLLLIALFGRIIINRLKWLANPRGVVHKIIGVLFVFVGIMIIFGIDKQIQSYVIEQGWYNPVMNIEESLIGR